MGQQYVLCLGAIHVVLFIIKILMANAVPKAFLLGHSFIRRLKSHLENKKKTRLHANFQLDGTFSVSLYGVGGRTVFKLRKFDLHVVRDFALDVVILEIGTNDLFNQRPETSRFTN